MAYTGIRFFSASIEGMIVLDKNLEIYNLAFAYVTGQIAREEALKQIRPLVGDDEDPAEILGRWVQEVSRVD
ncbi:MAG: hypothetical protein ACREGJ_01530 [Candidatus Saccharimonadales bacterium]